MLAPPEPADIVVTGSGGRLGRALLAASPTPASAWGRSQLDLDRPDGYAALLDTARPRLVVHAAAMTDVDACARHPELAMRRNADATGALAAACRRVGASLVLISTNEVFDGTRTDGQGYVESDEPRPANPYGASKMAAEVAAQRAFDGWDGLWVVRTAWLFGPPGNDFPDKIVATADRLPADEPLPVVDDEFGDPTATVDVARAVFELVAASTGGCFHVVSRGAASRYAWAERVLAIRRPGRTLRAIPSAAFERASVPPPWGVLDPGHAEAATGSPMRSWTEALADDLARRSG